MNNKLLIAGLLVAMIFVSCTPAPTAVPSKIPSTSTLETIPTATISIPPSQTPDKRNGVVIEPYQDVRFKNLSMVSASLGESLIKTLWFNESTVWLESDKQIAQNILQRGMNPGLGIRDLHEAGITGRGVNVAIIDQNMLLDHPEFEGKIVKYHDVGTDMPPNQGSMHGPAVTSLFVGENIGTAPAANVYYAAAPSWKGDAQYYADALNWIVDENETLPEGNKIRVVSVSAAPSGPGSPFTLHHEAWEVAYGRATQAGILVLDCTTHRGITAPCYYDLHDPDNVGKCIPGYPKMVNRPMFDRIYIPTSMRTTAEEYNQGSFSYQYDGQGGLSWTVPYLSGVLALGWQIDPDLSNSQILELLFTSAYRTEDGLFVINPKAFIEMIRSTNDK